jgi:uncharacterized protein YkwD
MNGWFRNSQPAFERWDAEAACGRRSVEGTPISPGGVDYASQTWIVPILLVTLAITWIGDRARARDLHDRKPTPEQVALVESSIRRYTNDARAKRHLKPLRRSAALTYLARGQSEHMCRGNTLKHESRAYPKGWRRFSQRLRIVGLAEGGENIAFRTVSDGPQQWAKVVVRSWMNSPEHRRNILRPEYRYIGVGVVRCRNGIAYATQVFSSSMGRAPGRAKRK